MQYNVMRREITPEMGCQWDGPAWKDTEIAAISHFHAKSSGHHPKTEIKMLHDDRGVYLHFRVSDRYVVWRQTEPQSPVCKDSCVEAFLQPKVGKGYFNFEVNCGCVMLLYYVTDPTRVVGGLKAFEPVAGELLEPRIRISHTVREKPAEEMDGPLDWGGGIFCSVAACLSGTSAKWSRRRSGRGGGIFYKCADDSSHPHWGSWGAGSGRR